MGPLFSSVALLMLAACATLIVFLLSAAINRAGGASSSVFRLAGFAITVALAFLFGCLLGAVLQIPFIGVGVTLASGIAVVLYLGIITATGVVVAALAGRWYWRVFGR